MERYNWNNLLYKNNYLCTFIIYRKRRFLIKYWIGEHKILTNILLAFLIISCKTYISDKKISRWISHAKRKNIDQTPRKKFGQIKKNFKKRKRLWDYIERIKSDICNIKNIAWSIWNCIFNV